MHYKKSYTDQELLELLQKGDDDAFTGIYLRYWDKLTVVAMNRLGSLEEAREVVQEVFCNLWRRREQLEIAYSLNTYLAAAVKYEIFKRFAVKSRRRRLEQQVLGQWQEAADYTLQYLNANELQSELSQLIKALPEKCRVVFQLSRDQGYTQKQIAKELGIAEKTVEAHLSAALRKLRIGLSHLFTLFF
jgi:RNA polymerase sigma-70 factor (family 1)